MLGKPLSMSLWSKVQKELCLTNANEWKTPGYCQIGYSQNLTIICIWITDQKKKGFKNNQNINFMALS